MSLARICDVADVFNGKTPSRADQRDAGHPVLKIRDVDEHGQFRGQFGSFVDASMADAVQNKKIVAGDTLILNAAHNADYVGSKCFLANADVSGALATGEWLVVRPRTAKIDARYAHYWLTSSRARTAIRDLVKGIHLYPKDLARLTIPLPPLHEQRRIAAILDKADALRRKRKRALELLDGLTESIFLDMFGHEIARAGKKVAPLGDIADLQNGAYFPPDRYVDGAEGVEMVHMSDAFYGIVERGALKRVSATALEQKNSPYLRET